MAFDANLAIAQLVDIYRNAHRQLLLVIARKEARGNTTTFQRGLLRDVESILSGLEGATTTWTSQVIPKVYAQSVNETMAGLAKAGITRPLDASFARLHRQAIEVISQNMIDNLADAQSFVGRQIRDQWRRVSLEAVQEKLTVGQTVREAKRELQGRIADAGLGAFRDSQGRVWQLDAYAEMVVRSTTAEATNQGCLNQLVAMDRDLVQMTDHRSPCEICAPLEGRVYSISGNTPGYPKLDIAYGEFANIHPSCRHRITSYVPELDPNQSATQARSNRPFDIDPRSAAERRAYDRGQEQNRLRRERRTLEREVAVLPDGPDKDAARERLRALRGQQTTLGKEQREYIESF